jgi:hypothetical protein
MCAETDMGRLFLTQARPCTDDMLKVPRSKAGANKDMILSQLLVYPHVSFGEERDWMV